MKAVYTILLLIVSNVFMTFAWTHRKAIRKATKNVI